MALTLDSLDELDEELMTLWLLELGDADDSLADDSDELAEDDPLSDEDEDEEDISTSSVPATPYSTIWKLIVADTPACRILKFCSDSPTS